MTRSFVIDNVLSASGKPVGFLPGRYLSSSPGDAVRKMFTQLSRNAKSPTSKLIIHVRESTSGSSDKIFKYSVKRVKDPRTAILDGKEVCFEYNTKVKSLV